MVEPCRIRKRKVRNLFDLSYLTYFRIQKDDVITIDEENGLYQNVETFFLGIVQGIGNLDLSIKCPDCITSLLESV